MQAKRFVFVAIIILVALLPGGVQGAPGDLGVVEAGLGSPVAAPRQVNLAPDGSLVVSIDQSSEVRRVDPATGAYTAYRHATALVSPVDARADGSGNVWFADWTLKRLGRITGSALTTWSLPAAVAPWGTSVDDSGRVWAADSFNPYLFRLEPTLNRVCRYTLPDGGTSYHVAYMAGKLWLGDYQNGRILRVSPAASLDRIDVESWTVPPDDAKTSSPMGLAPAEDGSMWWADHGLGILARLVPGTNLMTRFTPPAGTAPVMLTLTGTGAWYTEDGQDTVGFLDLSVASGQDTTLVAGAVRTLTPACQGVTPGQFAMTPSAGDLGWGGNSWASTASSAGWTVYQLPVSPERADPYGIVALPTHIWVADRGRHLVARFLNPSLNARVYVPLVTRP